MVVELEVHGRHIEVLLNSYVSCGKEVISNSFLSARVFPVYVRLSFHGRR